MRNSTPVLITSDNCPSRFFLAIFERDLRIYGSPANVDTVRRTAASDSQLEIEAAHEQVDDVSLGALPDEEAGLGFDD